MTKLEPPVASAFTCRGCGYDLRGLDAEASCPECSTPVARSTGGDLLRFCAPDWLKRLRLGLGLIVVGMLAELASYILLPLAFAVMSTLGAVRISIYVAFGAAAAAFAVVSVLGVWFATTPDPGGADRERGRIARQVARWCMIAAILKAPMDLIWGAAGWTGWPSQVMIVNALLYAGFYVSLLATGLGWIAFAVHAKHLAERLPRHDLAALAGLVMWANVVLMFAGIVGSALADLGVLGMTGGASLAYSIAAGVALLAWNVVVALFSVIVYLGLRKAIGAAMVDASGWHRTA